MVPFFPISVYISTAITITFYSACIITAADAQAYFPDPTVVCVNGESTLYIRSNAVKCPCHFKAEYWAKSIDVKNITAEIYALPTNVVDEWRSKAKMSFALDEPLPRIPSVTKGIHIRSVPLNKTIDKTKYIGWSSDKTYDIDDDKEYMVLSFFKSNNVKVKNTCLRARVILEPIPKACPIRLPPPPASPKTYVTGGRKMNNEEENFTEYNAHILNSPKHGNCTASVISSRWLLTAAHCYVRPGKTVAKIGTRNSTLYQVKKYIRHPEYARWDNATSGSVLNDIALIELGEQIPSPRIIPLNSNMAGPSSGNIVRISGYGRTATIKNSNSKVLGFVDVTVINNTECVRRFHSEDASHLALGIRENNHICIGRDEVCPGGGICYGDSGSGLIARNSDGGLVQVGIASYSVEKCASKAPDVFVRVAHYIQWIGKVTGDDMVQVRHWNAPGENTNSLETGSKIRSFWIIIIVFAAVTASIVISILCVVRHRTRRKVEVINDPVGITNKV